MNKAISCIARYTALEILHNRLIMLVLLGVFAAIGIGFFGHALAITESQQIQTIFMSASLRFFAIFIVVLVVISTISRELNDKSLEMILSLAITRANYYFGKLAGFNLVIILIALFFGVSLLISAPFEKVIIWTLSLYCELFLVLCFSLLCVMTVRQVPGAVMGVLAFYLLGRSIHAAVLMVDAPLISSTSISSSMMSTVVHTIAMLMPDLSHFTQSRWLIYADDGWSVLTIVILQTFVYSILLVSAGLIDFYRKNI